MCAVCVLVNLGWQYYRLEHGLLVILHCAWTLLVRLTGISHFGRTHEGRDPISFLSV